MEIHIIGAGGIGCMLLPALSRLDHEIHLWDADIIEKKNLSRQTFSTADIGEPKVNVLSDRYMLVSHNEYFNQLSKAKGVLFCCADNHPARLACLESADLTSSVAIIGCNETWTAEAYIYFPAWVDSQYDPRTYYPDLVTDHSGRPDAPCMSDRKVEENPQTVMANMTAANFMVRLFFNWTEGKRLTTRVQPNPFRPHRIRAEKFIIQTYSYTEDSNAN